jgi:hypothetical protein
VGAGVAVVAVAAAVVVPLTTLSGAGSDARVDIGGTPSPTSSPKGSPPDGVVQWRSEETYAATAVDGQIWAVVRKVTDQERWYLTEQDPSDGREIRSIEIQGPAYEIEVNGGTAWTMGGGDGGAYPAGVVNAVDLQSGADLTYRYPVGPGPYDLAVVGGSAWLTFTSRGVVDRLEVADSRLTVTATVAVPDEPTDVVSTQDGSLWVGAHRSGSIHEMSTGSSPRVISSYDWSGRLLAPDRPGSLWTSDADRRIVTLTPAGLECCVSASLGDRVQLPGQPSALATDGRGGVYVATYSAGSAGNGVAYFADFAGSGSASPDAFLPMKNVTHVTADPTGGVVVVADGAEMHWDPVSSGLRCRPR